MARINQFKTNTSAAEEGVWVKYAADIELKIAKHGNPAYKKRMQVLSRPHLHGQRSGELDPDVAVAIVKKASAEHILVGWKNIEDDNGNEIPYSPGAALEFFENPEYEDFFEFVKNVSMDVAMFRQRDHQESEGNSQAS